MNITLKQLRIFVAVARHDNISHAASQLSLTQSAVSMAIKELEDQLGLKLFDRSGKRIRINPQGEQLLPKAMAALDHIHAIADSVGQDSPQVVRAGASSTIADCLFPRLATRLYQQYPSLELHLETGNSQHILDQILRRKIELGLVEGICQHPQINAIPWWTDHLLIVASPQHPLARQAAAAQALPLKAFSGSSWIMRETGSGTRAIFEHNFQTVLPEISIRAEFKHVPTIKALVAAGHHLACLSEIMVHNEILSGELVTLPVRGMKLERQFHMLEHKQAYRSEVHRYLANWIKQQSSETVYP